MKEIIGIDIGGTSMNCALVVNSKIEHYHSANTDQNSNKEFLLKSLFNSIEKVLTNTTSAIGIGMPGFIDSKKGIIYDSVNIEAWRNLNIKKGRHHHV
jgi:glucokinase